ncbi:MAG: flagellar hook assembly protein FlgD [Pseudomonadota bacterium]
MAISTNSYDYSALVDSLNTSSSSKTTTAAEDAAAEISDRFLTLLVTQLKNQDPMNPMENAELTTQLAQMSTVEGINQLNSTVDALSSMMLNSQVVQGASLVGREVLAEGDLLTLTESGALGAVDLDSSVDTLKVNIYDDDGLLVRTLSVGAQDAGLVYFTWDGTDSNGAALEEGDYSFTVTATADGEDVTNTAYALGSVMSISLDGSTLQADIAGLGSRTLDQIKQYF